MHFYRQPHETLDTCSPGNALPFGPSLKFRRCSYATEHAGVNRMSIIGTLCYQRVIRLTKRHTQTCTYKQNALNKRENMVHLTKRDYCGICQLRNLMN